jgi:hypothetical protein
VVYFSPVAEWLAQETQKKKEKRHRNRARGGDTERRRSVYKDQTATQGLTTKHNTQSRNNRNFFRRRLTASTKNETGPRKRVIRREIAEQESKSKRAARNRTAKGN